MAGLMFMMSRVLMGANETDWVSAPKLYRIKDWRGKSEIAWVSDEVLAQLVPMYSPKGYSYELISVCDELEQIFKFRKDKSREPITQNDINDMLIDLHLLRGANHDI
jgi:hypothetical protein